MILRKVFLLLGTALYCCGADLSVETGEAYRLFPKDVVSFSVYGESDLSTTLRLSGQGVINLPLLGDVKIGGMTLAEAEAKISNSYIEREILVRPQITLQVNEYSKKEITMLGQISKQGKIELPPETAKLNIVEAISAAGGFTRIARADNVRITRKDPVSGEEKVYTVDAESMIAGRSKEKVFYVLPEDIIFIPERLF